MGKNQPNSMPQHEYDEGTPRPNGRLHKIRSKAGAVAFAALAASAAAGAALGLSHGSAPRPAANLQPAAAANPHDIYIQKAAAANAAEKARTTMDKKVRALTDGTAESIASMVAGNSHVSSNNEGEHGAGVWMSDEGDNSRTEASITRFNDTLTVNAINQPDGPDGKTFNNVQVIYSLDGMPKSEESRLDGYLDRLSGGAYAKSPNKAATDFGDFLKDATLNTAEPTSPYAGFTVQSATQPNTFHLGNTPEGVYAVSVGYSDTSQPLTSENTAQDLSPITAMSADALDQLRVSQLQ